MNLTVKIHERRNCRFENKVHLFLDEDSDTSSSRLLQAVIEHMKKQNVVDRANRETSSDLRENLREIKSTLNRMKKSDVAERSYANVVKKSAESRAEAASSQ